MHSVILMLVLKVLFTVQPFVAWSSHSFIAFYCGLNLLTYSVLPYLFHFIYIYTKILFFLSILGTFIYFVKVVVCFIRIITLYSALEYQDYRQLALVKE